MSNQLNPTQKNLGRAASLLGMCQGVVWFGLCLTCIVEYSLNDPPTIQSNNIWDKFNRRVFYFFLYKDAVLPAGTIVTPLVFTVFMCFYIVLTTIWTVTSIFLFFIVVKTSVNIPIIFKDWALTTWIISLVDLVLVVLIAVDFDAHCPKIFAEDICANTLISVLVIAARGFVLWFVNVIIAWRLFANANIIRKGGSYKGMFGGVIPIYNRSSFVDRRQNVRHIPRANVVSTPSLYSQQMANVENNKSSYWNVNLGTAMQSRTPPVSPRRPNSPNNNSQFFSRY